MVINYITYDSWWDTDITIIPELVKKYHLNVFVLSPFDNCKYPQKEIGQNVKLVHVRQKYRDRDLRSIGTAIKYFFKIYKECRRKDYINIFIPGKNPFFIILTLLFLSKKRTIICSHNYIEHGDTKFRGSKLVDFLKERFYQSFKWFHFYSEMQMDLFIKDYPSKDAFFTEMPLKDFGIAPIIEKKGNEVTLLFFGLIRDYKQLDLLIKDVNNLENPNLKVIIAGKATKEEQEKYLSLIKDKSIYELNFEFIPNENIPTIFSKADFLVLPYRSATQSGPSLIAINYSVPIIASDIVPFSDMVEDGVNGFLFESNNCEALTAVLKKVLMLNEEDISCLRRNQSKYREDYIRNNDICKLFQQFINDKILYQI